MGFLDDLADAVTNPLDHPFEAAMIMAMMEEDEEEDEDLDLFDDDDDFELEFDEAEETYSWREDAEDGEFYGLDPEDFESEREYDDELCMAEVVKDKLEENAERFGADVDLCWNLEEMKQEVYPRMDMWQLLCMRYGIPYYDFDEDTIEDNVELFCSMVEEPLSDVANFMELPLEGDVSEEEFFDACLEMSLLHIKKILTKMDKRVLMDSYIRERAKNLGVRLNQYRYYNELVDELIKEDQRQTDIGSKYGIDRRDYKSKKSFLRDVELVKEHLGPIPFGGWTEDVDRFLQELKLVKAVRRLWLKKYKAAQKNSKAPVEKTSEKPTQNDTVPTKGSDGSGSVPPIPEHRQGEVSDKVREHLARKKEKEERDKFYKNVGFLGVILIMLALNTIEIPFYVIILAEIVWICIVLTANIKAEKRANDNQEKTQEKK